MKKTCSNCQSPFEITDDDLTFLESVSPVFGGKKFPIPPPTRCPDCRQQRRLSLCNERNFYPAKCGLCGQSALTEHPTHKNKTVYCRDCWHSDKWDPREYGMEMDFSRPFFEQFKELRSRVPAQNLLSAGTVVNSDYIHYAGFAKNCYLIMHADYCEDSMYGYGFKKTISCFDGFYNLQCELCYEGVDLKECYGLTGCQDCINCRSGAFLRDCIGCQDCFLCIGLRNKKYCFDNEQLSKDDYLKKMQSIHLKSRAQYDRYKAELKKLEEKHTFKEYQGHNLENSSGDHLINCKDVRNSFDCEDIEHGKFCYQVVTGGKDIYDIYQYGLNLQQSYECAIAGNDSYNIRFSHNIHVSCTDLFYCWYMQSSKSCFGCCNMHHKEYCILNKQYTKAEYEKLVPQIIEHMKKSGEWGEMFPTTVSPFGYNKTTASMYYPMKREDVLAHGWEWDDHEPPPPSVTKIIDGGKLPDSLDDIPDDVLNWAIRCEVTGKLFKIQPLELKLYRQIGLPLPRRSPDQRHMDRFMLRNPKRFWKRTCGKCGKEITTTWDPKRPEKVYCEECYKKEVY